MNTLKLLVLVGTLSSFPAQAEIYKYVDEHGRVTYSNIPRKGAKKLELEPLVTVPGGKRQTATPQEFPRVDANTQKKRDDSRRKILGDELSAEEQALADAKKALAAGEAVRLGDERNYQKYLDRIQKLKDEVTLHENNVAALKKEISGLADSESKAR